MKYDLWIFPRLFREEEEEHRELRLDYYRMEKV